MLFSFFNELRRRNVIRMAGLYLVGAWLIVQVASTILPAFDLPGWMLRVVITTLAIGLVPALVLAWAFELTPEGLQRERDASGSESVAAPIGKRLDRIIMVVLALALGYFAFDKFLLSPQRGAALQRQRSVDVAAAGQKGQSEAIVKSYDERSIAVLPFADMSAGKDQEYFTDGIAEELLNLLTQVPQLRVTSRASAFSFKGKQVAIPEIAQRLNVAHVMAGSVRKSGNRVRISVQLIDARSDTLLWSDSWDRDLQDIFAVQDEIAAAVVQQLKIQLLGDAPRSKPVDPDAYALFLQARALSNRGTKEGYRQSALLYKQALGLAPDYAAAWLGQSGNYFRMANAALLPADEGFGLAREAVNRALAIDPDDSQAHAMSAWLDIFHDNDLAAAAKALDRALALEPTSSFVIGKSAGLMFHLGRLDEAIALGVYEVARDPLYAPGHANLAIRYLTAGRFDAAIASYQTALRLSPGYSGVQAGISLALLLLGKNEAALEAIREEPDQEQRLLGLALAYHALGRSVDSDRALADYTAAYGKTWPSSVAAIAAWRGEADRAFDWLRRAVQSRDPALLELVYLPYFAPIHGDSRWLPFLSEIGRAPGQLAEIKFAVQLPE